MFSFLRSRRREINNLQSVDDALTGTKNNEQKNRTRTRRMGSILTRHFRSFLATVTSWTSADIPFTCLPPEIITRVLYYLPLRDRKNVRLTCKLLNQCSRDVSITSMEKLAIPMGGEVPWDEVLLQTNSAVLNLEFITNAHGDLPSINSNSTDVWKTCGDRVRSVYIYDFPKAHVLLDILMYCGGLQSIKLRSLILPDLRPVIQLLSVLNILVELNITRTELRFLHISRVSNDDLLRTIFVVFPNLEHLYAGFDDLELKTECLKPFMRLRSLTYKMISLSSTDAHVQTYWSAHQIAPELPKRVTKFRTNPSDSDLCPMATDSFLLRFLAVQNEVEVLRLSLPYDCERIRGIEVMFLVLRSCPKLREFHFPVWDPDWKFETSDKVTEFVTLLSNLRSLTLGCVPSIPNGLSLPSTKFMLRSLAVTHSKECNQCLLLHILRHSPEMHHLSIIRGARMTHFRAACRYMPELRSLILRDQLVADVFDDWSPLDVGGFQNLRYMELSFRRTDALPLWQIKFRRLQHVKLTIDNEYPDPNDPDEKTYREIMDIYRKILWNMPALQIAHLPWLGVGEEREDIELLQNIKSLRHLICYSVSESDTLLRRLFKTCKNLDLLSRVGYRIGSFSFDSSAKRIVFKELHCIKEEYREVPACFDFL